MSKHSPIDNVRSSSGGKLKSTRQRSATRNTKTCNTAGYYKKRSQYADAIKSPESWVGDAQIRLEEQKQTMQQHSLASGFYGRCYSTASQWGEMRQRQLEGRLRTGLANRKGGDVESIAWKLMYLTVSSIFFKENMEV